MSTFADILMARSAQLNRVDFESEARDKAQHQADQQSSSINHALLRHTKFVESKNSADAGTERALREERESREREKREAEEREIEHRRRVADPTLCAVCGIAPDRSARDTISALDRLWHGDCWKCSYCKQALEFPGEFYHIGYKLLCARDYKMRYHCAHCEKFILGEPMNLFGKSYHRDCVIERGCFACQKPISQDKFLLACECAFHIGCLSCDKCKAVCSDAFVLVHGRPWCVGCNDKFCKENPGAKKDLTRKLHQIRLFIADQGDEPAGENACGRCRKEVIAGMNAVGKMWHNECFCCDSCGVNVADIGYYPSADDTQAFCEACYIETVSEKCYGCGKAIVDEVLSVLDHLYHPNCLVCYQCRQPLGQEIAELDGHPVCGICIRRDRVAKGMKA